MSYLTLYRKIPTFLKTVPLLSQCCYSTKSNKRDITFRFEEAIKYLRALTLGREYANFSITVNLDTVKGSVPVRGYVRLPFPEKKQSRICVIAEGQAAQQARQSGADVVGGKDIIDLMKKRVFDYNICLAHTDSLNLLKDVARILGPRNLMPSVKHGTASNDIISLVKTFKGTTPFRERKGMISQVIGPQSYSDEKLAANLKAILAGIRKCISKMEQKRKPRIKHVYLHGTHTIGIKLGRV
ncbi:mitochondrial 54S ribosomal protein MRPL1 [Schizosaccharomyces japonicus yFS275]|uniref:Ribosomal protein subunit L1 n=1 Tax=Schizosaccharomyces japonicus (strain yFS275 / FY16936) TaxID=402676 RepID=B6K3U3_SCHJY|nr:mitochondrial 54S ribosomal protein MRPL1 [Schizosaccharomyces japonicus yFS275]EEB08150.1 ribosomal protein subunit L1 [Schizosaccharomyces japonicus yFS275]